MAFKSLLAGLAAGLLAVIYRLATEKGTVFAAWVYGYIRLHPVFALLWAAVAVAAGLFIAWLIKVEPMAAGGGVPQVEGVVLYGMKMRWYAVIAVRYAAGILGSLFGLSFGPEGPSIQLGAAVNQGLSKKICKTGLGENYLVTAGAAAGLSTAFSAPLTGMIFALEEIHRSFSPAILFSATAASLTADFISKYFFGLRPVLYFQAVPQLPLRMYAWLFPLGVFAGLFGVLTNRGMLLLQTLYGRVPARLRPTIALLLCLPCGLLLPQVLGGGRNMLDIVGHADYPLLMVFTLLTVKLLFSCTSFGSGTPGGIFMPIISISALSGTLFGMLATLAGSPAKFLPVFVICAMAGGLAACVKAPVTSIILTIELTGSFIHVLPVAIVTFVALFFSDLLHTTPIYEALLKRFIVKNGYTVPTEKRGTLIEFPVEVGSEASGSLLRDIDWPAGSLVVGLRRGSEELIPKGGTRILPGDYLLILAPQRRENTIRRKIRTLCRNG
jgi:H+/Cl- antiporter ClcA